MHRSNRIVRRAAGVASALALLLSLGVGGALAAGHPGFGFYVDDVAYRTFGTTTDFGPTGAPAGTYDKIYALGAGLHNVAEAKPGDTDFNGGRWAVYPVTWTGHAPVQLTSDAAVLAAEQAGWLTIAETPVRYFFCPVIPLV
jgi:hypothetical protein